MVFSAMVLLWSRVTAPAAWVCGAVALTVSVLAAIAVRKAVVRPLQTVSNLLAALREEDFSIQASGARHGDALGEVFAEINTLSGILREQRLGALEATALLRTVMQEIDVAVFAFDQSRRLQLVNRAGERILGQPVERLLGRDANELALADYLEGEAQRTVEALFPGGAGRWSVRRTVFRQGGSQRHLLVLADLSRALRQEERQAWQRLVRVLGHEINNSLTPIKSISTSLASLAGANPLPDDWRQDMAEGLGIIASRSEALHRFMTSYTRLARLPAPVLKPLELGQWIRRVVTLETRVPITIDPGPEVTIDADSDQLEQILINLLRNAAEASLSTHNGDPQVRVSWSVLPSKHLQLLVTDNGPGVANPGNMFVPFFTTKPGGSGIGLVLSRQIAESHGGTLTLENRQNPTGCIAKLALPPKG